LRDSCIPSKGRSQRPVIPIMGQNDRRSPIMKPALLSRALIAGFVAVLMAVSPAGAQTAPDKVSFGTNWVAEAEHGGFFQALADGTTRVTGSTSPSCRAAQTTTIACC
jgi:hypothetical protein